MGIYQGKHQESINNPDNWMESLTQVSSKTESFQYILYLLDTVTGNFSGAKGGVRAWRGFRSPQLTGVAGDLKNPKASVTATPPDTAYIFYKQLYITGLWFGIRTLNAQKSFNFLVVGPFTFLPICSLTSCPKKKGTGDWNWWMVLKNAYGANEVELMNLRDLSVNSFAQRYCISIFFPEVGVWQ